MRKTILTNLLLAVILLTALGVSAQKTQIYLDEDYDYRIGVDLFNKQHYSQAQLYFERVVAHYGNEFSDIKADAEYYAALCALELFNSDAEYRIGKFINDYPESPRTRVAYFEMGRYQYRANHYKEAIDYFDRVWKQNLNKEQLAELYFKKGYSYFKLKQYDRASKMFYELVDGKSKYANPAIYFYAHIAYTNKNYETALNNLNKIENDPTFAPVVPYYRLQIYFIQGKDDKVIELGKAMFDQTDAKRQAEMSRIVGEALYNKEMYTEAVPYLEIYKSKADNYTREDIYQLGYAYFKTGEFQQAATTMSNVTNINDELTQNAYYHIAYSNMQLQQKEQARMAFAAASKYDFNDRIKEQSLLNYAKLSYELSYSPFNETIKAFNKYLELYPNSVHHDEAYEYLVKAYLSSKNYQAALESIAKIKNKTAEMQSAWQRVAYFRGLELYNNLKFEESVEAFNKVVELKAYDKEIRALAQYWKGEALYRLEKYNDAATAYNNLLTTPGAYTMPEYKTCYYNIGYCYFKTKDYIKSADWFRKYTEKPSEADTAKLADSYIRIGDCYFVSSKFSDAALFYGMAADMDAFDVEYALFQKGFAMGLGKDLTGKIKTMSDLLRRYPKSNYAADALFERARAYTIIDSTQLAINDFHTLAKNYPNSSYVVKSLLQTGLLYYADGQNYLAIDNFKSVIEKYPGTSEADEALFALKNVYVDMNKVDDYYDYAKSRGNLSDIDISERDSLTYASAEKVYMTGNWREAGGLFDSYLDKFPEGKFSLNATYYRGDCNLKMHNNDKAREDFEAIAARPKNMFTEASLLSAASLAEGVKDYKQAVELYKKLEDNAEVKSNLMIAREGQMQNAFADSNFNAAIEAARKVLITDKISEEQIRRARYVMAVSYYQTHQLDPSITQFRILALDMTNKEGAEAQYMVARMLFEEGEMQKSEDAVNALIASGTSHFYWIAKSFFLLSDICMKRGDRFQAKANLQSVIENYGDTTDGIVAEGNAKLKLITDEENEKFVEDNSTQEVEIKFGEESVSDDVPEAESEAVQELMPAEEPEKTESVMTIDDNKPAATENEQKKTESVPVEETEQTPSESEPSATESEQATTESESVEIETESGTTESESDAAEPQNEEPQEQNDEQTDTAEPVNENQEQE
ncbi:MAG: tetratricopeptide repeat protein [Salinivirgaceae bacterium]|nr:tetratricopeptide repeat protein [Salinivirgaceae bacterium]